MINKIKEVDKHKFTNFLIFLELSNWFTNAYFGIYDSHNV